MKSSQEDKKLEVEQGKAIARGIAEANTQKDKNMAREAKRKESMLRNAIQRVFRNY